MQNNIGLTWIYMNIHGDTRVRIERSNKIL